MRTKQQPGPSLSMLITELWAESVRLPRYSESLWQALVALAPVLEVRGPSSALIDVTVVEEAMQMTSSERSWRLRDLVGRLRASAELGRGYHAASWRALERELGLLGPRKGVVQEPTKRQLALTDMRRRADAVLTALHGRHVSDEDAAHQLRVLLDEARRWRGGGAWLRFHLAGVLERSGDVDEAYRHARLAFEADPLDLRYQTLCRKLGAVLTARDAGFTSGERGQA